MNRRIAFLLLFTASIAACSSSSSAPSSPRPDASTDAAVDSTAPPPEDAAPQDDARLPPDAIASDASPTCQKMLAMVGSLQPAAQACMAGAPNQCTGEAMGVCCNITVSSSASSQDAIDAFVSAAATYVQQCHINCSNVGCPTNVPSRSCTEGATSGVCM